MPVLHRLDFVLQLVQFDQGLLLVAEPLEFLFKVVIDVLRAEGVEVVGDEDGDGDKFHQQVVEHAGDVQLPHRPQRQGNDDVDDEVPLGHAVKHAQVLVGLLELLQCVFVQFVVRVLEGVGHLFQFDQIGQQLAQILCRRFRPVHVPFLLVVGLHELVPLPCNGPDFLRQGVVHQYNVLRVGVLARHNRLPGGWGVEVESHRCRGRVGVVVGC